jgi:hypothetical protein
MKKSRAIRVTVKVPKGISSDRWALFMNRALALGIERSQLDAKSAAGKRGMLLRMGRVGPFQLKELLRIALRILDEENMEIFLRSLVREMRSKEWGQSVVVSPIDLVILRVWDGFDILCLNHGVPAPMYELPPLSRWSHTAASAVVSFLLYQDGIKYVLSSEAYRKRIKRLGLSGQTPHLISRADFKPPAQLTVYGNSDKT